MKFLHSEKCKAVNREILKITPEHAELETVAKQHPKLQSREPLDLTWVVVKIMALLNAVLL